MSQEPRIFCDIAAQLGEGVTYDPTTDTVWWFDIESKRLFERGLTADRTTIHELPFMASALARIDAGRQLVMAEDGLYIRDVATGALTLHRPIEADNPATRSNDSRVHASGAFWISTMGKGGEPKAGAIYWYRRGEVKQLYPEIGIPNSISFAPDGSIAYFTDTKDNRIMRVAIDPWSGLPTAEPEVLVDKDGQKGGHDGSVVDADGVLWNARWGSGKLYSYRPDGTLLRTVDMPAAQVSCPAFVGQKADRVVVTSAWSGLSEAERAADPEAGKTFILDLGVPGRHEPDVVL
ncbi:SMP-30/gluconolactonase/LRE family protein [Mangrovicella endophytica]|uniref:SMP-30/gluconolactonase/LRE family protein n=1 Tax=Mangrovicella endophytica TaxID=2066697 RepID=UPI000C9E1472|nr:SMP-30/gluconolactonase/LRE family protein [Mangrovicella endophytica]